MNENTVFEYANALGTVRFSYDSDLWITDIDGVSSVDVSLATSQGFTQVGTTISGQSIQPVKMTVNGCIFGDTEENRGALIRIIAPNVESIFTVTTPEGSWQRDVVPEVTPIIQAGKGAVDFQFRLYCAFPYWRTVKESEHTIIGIEAAFEFPFNENAQGNYEFYLSRFTEELYKVVENTGNVPENVEITFASRLGDVVNPQITNVSTGQTIKINATLAEGERYVINTTQGNTSITKIAANGKKTNGFKYLAFGSDMTFCLQAGENVILGDAQSGTNNLTVSIKCPQGLRSGV